MAHILSKLSTEHQTSFKELYRTNPDVAIAVSKINVNLFNLAFEFPLSDIKKIATLSKIIDQNKVVNILKSVTNPQIVTVSNVSNVSAFFDLYSDFCSKKVKIEWGIGNHSTVESNINEHYKKHIDGNECEYWKSFLGESKALAFDLERSSNNVTLEMYTKFPLSNFYSMERIVLHSNGRDVHLSGFVDKFFIVGKFNSGVFSISSCYYVPSGEKKGRYATMLFYLDKW